MKKSLLMAGVAGMVAAMPTTGFAQDAGAETAVPADDGNIIIVTARKRAESLQETPTTVAVATAETIDRLGLDGLGDISKTTAGLTFDSSGGRNSNRPVIRGQANILGQSGVAFFIDGIYYTGSLADYDVDTIERIEVVKGPQSALYGRNTYSGAINIISKLPDDDWEGRVTADIAENDRYEVTAGIRGPISDSLGFGVNGRFYDYGGEFVNLFDGEKIGEESSYSLSGVLAYDNGGPFTASLRGYYNRTDDGQPVTFAQSADANNCLFDLSTSNAYRGAGRYFCGTIQPGEINTDWTRQFAAEDLDDVGLEADTYNVSLRMEYELSDNLTLTSLTGYNNREEQFIIDGDYSPGSFQTAVFARFPFAGFPFPPFDYAFVGTTVDFSFASLNKTEDWSQEIRLTYESDSFDVIVGGYYFDQSDDSFDIRNVPDDAASRALGSFFGAIANEQAICAANPICGSVTPFFGPSTPNSRDESLQDIENKAVFGAVEWHITPDFNIGIEGRYAEEKVDLEAYVDFDEGDMRPAPVLASRTFKEFTPRITADYQLSPDNLLYAVYAEGQKPGGFNSTVAILADIDAGRDFGDPLAIGSYEAEDNKSYEIGLKNAFLDNSLIANVALFHSKITGYQLTQNVQNGPNQISIITNAGDARINGAELELLARPSNNLTITANYALADTKFTEGFDENQGLLNDIADDGLGNCSTGDQFPDVSGCQSLFGSIDGKRIPRAPVHQVFLDADWRMPVGAGDWEVFLGGNVSMTSKAYAQVHNLASFGSATVVDVRAGFQSDRYKVQFYVDNLTNEDSVPSVIRYASGGEDFRRNFIGSLRPTRRLGVILSAGF